MKQRIGEIILYTFAFAAVATVLVGCYAIDFWWHVWIIRYAIQ